MSIRDVFALGQPPWPTFDPFLFCVHHNDAYPAGDGTLAPRASLAGRTLGQDFSGRDGWSMYHGRRVPGFPQHPHRGFETITLARQGFIDHSDSLGARARFGNGDVQWMTAGRGIVHSEMFPLLDEQAENPTELFQIWLNLPAHHKLVEPYFTMLWADTIPQLDFTDADGRATRVTLIAGSLDAVQAPTPPPNSWASQPGSELMILTIELADGASWTLPASQPDVQRTLYFFQGQGLALAGQRFEPGVGIRLDPRHPVQLTGGPGPTELLLLQGRAIREPVAHHGPFVMNTRQELQQAFRDYQQTGFGGWPWPQNDPVHGDKPIRFAVHPDGREDRPA